MAQTNPDKTSDPENDALGLIRFAASAAKYMDIGSGTGMSMPVEWRQRETAKHLLQFALNLMGRRYPKLKSQLKTACRDFYLLSDKDNLFPMADYKPFGH